MNSRNSKKIIPRMIALVMTLASVSVAMSQLTLENDTDMCYYSNDSPSTHHRLFKGCAWDEVQVDEGVRKHPAACTVEYTARTVFFSDYYGSYNIEAQFRKKGDQAQYRVLLTDSRGMKASADPGCYLQRWKEHK